MFTEMMHYYGFVKELKKAGYFVDESYGPMFEDLKTSLLSGSLVALTGPIGVGKTSSLQKIKNDLEKEASIKVVTSLSIDKHKVNLQTLIDALVAELIEDDDIKLHKRSEFRMRQLQKLVSRKTAPVALFIDEAHDLPLQTLIELKRLMELISSAGGALSIFLIGHPRLRADIQRAFMQEIGMRTQHLVMKGIEGREEKFFDWMITSCLEPQSKISDVFTPNAKKLIISKLKTPLEMMCFTWKTLQEGFLMGEKPISEDTVRDAIGRSFDTLESRLTRQGYSPQRLSECLNASVHEIRDFLRGRLPAGRAIEIEEELSQYGIAVGEL